MMSKSGRIRSHQPKGKIKKIQCKTYPFAPDYKFKALEKKGKDLG